MSAPRVGAVFDSQGECFRGLGRYVSGVQEPLCHPRPIQLVRPPIKHYEAAWQACTRRRV